MLKKVIDKYPEGYKEINSVLEKYLKMETKDNDSAPII